jgi:hypothetical protein
MNIRSNGKSRITGILAAGSLALTCISSHAQYVTNFMAYNFDTCPPQPVWTGIGEIVSVQCDPTEDSSNNPNSGSMVLTVNYQGGQWLLSIAASPSNSPVPIQGQVAFTNLQFDVKYYSTAPGLIRTNVSPWDFGYIRVGSLEASYGQDWYGYYAVPATNGLGQPNTNWVHIQVDLNNATNYPGLASSGLMNIMFNQDDSGLSGTQYIWFDNIFYTGWVSPLPPPTMSIQTATPCLELFGGIGVYGRSQLQITTNYLNDGWIGPGTTYPVSYSFTVNDNATTPGGLDTHLTFLPATLDTGYEGYSAEDYVGPDTLWLQIISGSGTNTSCVVNFSWKTNDSGCDPNYPSSNGFGGVAVWFTNSVRAGTWTLTWSNDVSGSITCPGTNSTGLNPIPFNLSVVTLSSNTFGTNFAGWSSGNNIAPALTSAGADANFANPMVVRFGDMNNGNSAHAAVPDQWNSISVSGTAGTNFTVDFTQQGFNTNTMPSGLDPNLWDLTSSDGGAAETIQVPTNAPYWLIWETNGYYLEDATNLNGPWYLVYANTNTNGPVPYTLPTQTLHAGTNWNLMLSQYLPTANGAPGGPLSPTAYFRLSTNAPPP